MKLRDALRSTAERLSVVSDTPRLDAEVLAAHILGVDRNALLLSRLDDEAPGELAALIERRLASEPVAYIIGSRDFWTLTLKVAPGVLIPRPDSETLIEAALGHFATSAPSSILDLGTGSGALLLAALSEFPTAKGLGVDQSATALAIASENAQRCALDGRASFKEGDWGADLGGTYDLILCNPPYIVADVDLPKSVVAYEPASALFAGADGLSDYRKLAPDIARLLAPGGCAVVEIGYDQADTVGTMFSQSGLNVEVCKDLGARDRCLVLTQSL